MKLVDILESNKPPESGELHLSYKDFVSFYWKYRGLIKERERNNAFWTSTNENLKMAYEKLDESERKLDSAYNLNKKYLDNITEGLCLIDKDFIIQGQYSEYLKKLFKIGELEGMNFIDFIFPDKTEEAVDRKEMEKFLSVIFYNVTADLEMIMDINPLKDRTLLLNRQGKKSEITVNARFTRVYEQDDVRYIMVLLEDRTSFVKMEKRLKQEKNRHQAEIETLSALLHAGPKAFLDFIEEMNGVLHDFNEKLRDMDQKEIYDYLFRQIHSLKGSAKYFKLNYIADLAHKIETRFQQIKSSGDGFFPQRGRIEGMLKELHDEMHHIEELNNKILVFSKGTGDVKDMNDQDETFDNLFKSLKQMAADISGELNKNVKLEIHNKLDDFPFMKKIKNPIIHLIRNAIDHGIEDNFRRMSLQKSDTGSIKLEFFSNEKNYIIKITDDGQGIDFDEVKKKAVEKKFISEDANITHAKLLNILFSPSFSSRDTVSQYSGRGYGLDIVKDVVKSLDGKIVVLTKPEKGTSIVIEIPVKEHVSV